MNWLIIGMAVYAVVTLIFYKQILDTFPDDYTALDTFCLGLACLTWPLCMAIVVIKRIFGGK